MLRPPKTCSRVSTKFFSLRQRPTLPPPTLKGPEATIAFLQVSSVSCWRPSFRGRLPCLLPSLPPFSSSSLPPPSVFTPGSAQPRREFGDSHASPAQVACTPPHVVAPRIRGSPRKSGTRHTHASSHKGIPTSGIRTQVRHKSHARLLVSPQGSSPVSHDPPSGITITPQGSLRDHYHYS